MMRLLKKTELFVIVCLVFSLVTSCTSCKCRGRGNGPNGTDSTTVETGEEVSPSIASSTKPTINVYIENSGSMNGFINNASGFQDAIQTMVSYLSNYYGEEHVNLNLINRQVYPFHPKTGESNAELATRMTTLKTFTHTGDVRTTDLNDIIKQILGKTNSENISILISDCIYSVSGTGTTTSMLTSCSNLTMDAFLKNTGVMPGLSTLFVKLNSPFSGRYFDYRHPNVHSQVLNCKRPYYMCIIGPDAKISELDSSIRIERLNGFEQKMKMTSTDLSNSCYSVLKNFSKKGSFHYTTGGVIHTLTNAQPLANGEFSFSVGVDLSRFPLSEKEKGYSDLYSVEGGYVIDSIIEKTIGTFTQPDNILIANYNLTHIITLHNDSGTIGNCDIHLCKQLPQWVMNTSSTDDTRIGTDESEKCKTFGLEYFVSGIYRAFARASKNEDYYMNIKVNIN